MIFLNKMGVKKFEDLRFWQKSKIMSSEIYRLLKDNKDFAFRDQIQRASVSVMNNIAEGFERKGNKEFKYFLYMAKASCGEVRSMLYLAVELEYINKAKCRDLYILSVEISRMISGFIRTLD